MWACFLRWQGWAIAEVDNGKCLQPHFVKLVTTAVNSVPKQTHTQKQPDPVPFKLLISEFHRLNVKMDEDSSLTVRPKHLIHPLAWADHFSCNQIKIRWNVMIDCWALLVIWPAGVAWYCTTDDAQTGSRWCYQHKMAAPTSWCLVTSLLYTQWEEAMTHRPSLWMSMVNSDKNSLPACQPH